MATTKKKPEFMYLTEVQKDQLLLEFGYERCESQNNVIYYNPEQEQEAVFPVNNLPAIIRTLMFIDSKYASSDAVAKLQKSLRLLIGLK